MNLQKGNFNFLQKIIHCHQPTHNENKYIYLVLPTLEEERQWPNPPFWRDQKIEHVDVNHQPKLYEVSTSKISKTQSVLNDLLKRLYI